MGSTSNYPLSLGFGLTWIRFLDTSADVTSIFGQKAAVPLEKFTDQKQRNGSKRLLPLCSLMLSLQLDSILQTEGWEPGVCPNTPGPWH